MSAVTLLGLLVVTGLVQSGVSIKTISLNNKISFNYVFDRPIEPIFMPKGINAEVVFVLPNKYLPERYQPLEGYIRKEYITSNRTQIIVHEVPIPDLDIALRLGRHQHFSTFIPYHGHMADHLIKIFLGMNSYADFLSVAIYCRLRINPFLWVYAMSISILHRSDTQDVRLPLYISVFPEKFFTSNIFSKLREEGSIVEPDKRIPIEIPRDYTASDLEPEHRLAYFREDLGVNQHHWHWHLTYPFSGPVNVVNKDRRGELFYYLHTQIVARYNFERFSNKLSRVTRLVNWRISIPEGYFPKMDNLVASRVWPPRQADTLLHDVNREDVQFKVDILDLEHWRDRIFEAIHMGRARNERGNYVILPEVRGIDILGNMVEPSILSINPNLYGSLHNSGHLAIAYCHDPDNRYLEDFAVMGDTPTSMRDVIFYRWHAFIDDLFQEYKNTLPPYTPQQLRFDGIQVTGLDVQVEGGRTNEFSTFWQKSDIDLAQGMDFGPRGPLFLRVTHLQHLPFTYRIQVVNSGKERTGTVRIFMAPKFDERGLPFVFREQKLLFIELDKFQVNLRSGRSLIQRRSVESSVTVPYEQTYKNFNTVPPTDEEAADVFNYCGCGWPENMLIPKGTPEGLPADLFVMVSDYANDKVEQQPLYNTCQDAHSYCGIRGQMYPDRQTMGFPFDHLPSSNIQTLSDFLTPNMKVVNVSIRFTDITVPPGDGITHVRSPKNTAGRPTYLPA